LRNICYSTGMLLHLLSLFIRSNKKRDQNLSSFPFIYLLLFYSSFNFFSFVFVPFFFFSLQKKCNCSTLSRLSKWDQFRIHGLMSPTLDLNDFVFHIVRQCVHSCPMLFFASIFNDSASFSLYPAFLQFSEPFS